jgi:hypothetical protein
MQKLETDDGFGSRFYPGPGGIPRRSARATLLDQLSRARWIRDNLRISDAHIEHGMTRMRSSRRRTAVSIASIAGPISL